MDNTLAMTLQPQTLEPSAEEVALLTRQYQKALDGLYEAYRFGMMLLSVRRRLEDAADARESRIANGESDTLTGDGQAAEADGLTELERFYEVPTGDAARGTARNGRHGGSIMGGGWNRGMGLKGWLAQYCPEINYSTARRFLAVAEKTVSALALADAEGGEGALAGAGEQRTENGEQNALTGGEAAEPSLQASNLPNFPPEAKVREFLAGKSQRSILRLGGKREGAGRKAKDWAAALEASPEVAWKEIEEPLERLSRLIVRERRHAVLTAQDLHTLRDAIDLLHEVIHADA